ncbi:MAG: hypothetical protein K6G38_06080 [Gammaproteobacteria bacterium]|nr:hypothetical protein [Gammaproteobacteria bacterium]
MKKIRFLSLFLALLLSITSLSACVWKGLEKELNVVFMYEDEYIEDVKISQFQNALTPTLSSGYIPDGYKFFGWTPLDPNEVQATDENFKEEYVGPGKIVHWADVEEYAVNSTVVCKALIIDKELIPKVYHYALIAWYNKPSTTGITEDMIIQMESSLKAYLKNEGVKDEDIATIVLRDYTGNVGPSCGAIMEDGDVDIMLGWSSKSNVIDTGGMKEEMLLESVSFQVGEKNRMIHRLSDSETVIKVFNWLQSDECKAIFN